MAVLIACGLFQLTPAAAAPAAQAGRAQPGRICAMKAESARALSGPAAERRAQKKLAQTLGLIKRQHLGEVPQRSFISTVCESDKAVVTCTASVMVCN
jgi:hypothetical protein